jgi:hypothetical protein
MICRPHDLHDAVGFEQRSQCNGDSSEKGTSAAVDSSATASQFHEKKFLLLKGSTGLGYLLSSCPLSVGGRQDELTRSAARLVPMSDQLTSESATSALPMVDILPLVLQYLSKDIVPLYACALVDRNSNRATSAVLYRHIVFSPPWTTVLDLREVQKYSVRSWRTTVVRHHLTANLSDREPYYTPPHSHTMPLM